MRISYHAAALSLALFCPFASAASSETPQTACQTLLNKFRIENGENVQLSDRPNGCVLTNGKISLTTYQTWTFKHAEFAIDNFAGIQKDPKIIPAWGRLNVEGLTSKLVIPDPVLNFITEIQQWPIDFTASYRWHPAEGRIELENAQIINVRNGIISVSASLVTDKKASPQDVIASSSIGVSRIRLRIDNQGLLEHWIALIASSGLIFPDIQAKNSIEFETQVDAAKKKSMAVVAAMPDAQMDAASRQALSRFIQDMPHPTGFFSIEVEFAKPLMLSQLKPDADETAIRTLLSNARATVTYTAR